MAIKKGAVKPAGNKAGKSATTVKKAPAKPSRPAAAVKKVAKPAAKAAKKPAPSKAQPSKPAMAKKKVAAKPAVKAVSKPAVKTMVKPVKKPVVASKAEVAPKKPMVQAPVKSINSKSAPSKPVPHVDPVKKPAVVAPLNEDVKPNITPIMKPAPKKESPRPPAKVVIPKTSTNKAVKYNPDFMKSVLDTNAQEHTGPTMRYSDLELTEFRELIGKKLDTAKKELAYLQGLITRKDEGGDMEDGRYMTMEDGSMSMEREQLSQMASRQIQFIDHLEKAMMRIENKTYGICRVTGKLIDKARLRAVPHATLSIEAKQMMNK